MSDIGYNDNVNVNGRTFHIQTGSNFSKGIARCEVFEGGKLIASQVVDFERRRMQDEESLEKRIRNIVSDLHQETIAEIDLMFQISDKVKKLRHAPSNIKLGLIFLSNNLINDAIEQFETARSMDPDSAAALNNLGLAYIRLGQNTKAAKYLNEALGKGHPFADIYHNLGLAFLNEKQHYKALKNFQEALRINPNYLNAHYNLVILYLESILTDKSDTLLPPPSIRLERARQQLEKVEASENKIFSGIYPNIISALDHNEIEKAVQILENNRDKVFPQEILGLIGMDFYLKFMYGGKGLNEEMIKRFEHQLNKALESHSDYADLWNNLGIVHLIQCRNLFLQALNEFDHALEINPAFDKARKNKKLVENDGKEFLILLRAILR
jgi:tetratricopeptide (TPR) repeat protein